VSTRDRDFRPNRRRSFDQITDCVWRAERFVIGDGRSRHCPSAEWRRNRVGSLTRLDGIGNAVASRLDKINSGRLMTGRPRDTRSE
jgi:hypothetical protein